MKHKNDFAKKLIKKLSKKCKFLLHYDFLSDIILPLRKHKIQSLVSLGGAKMAKCDICGKGAHFGNNVSHSHRRSNRIWNSNVQNVMCKMNGSNKKLHVCTRCLRSGKVERA